MRCDGCPYWSLLGNNETGLPCFNFDPFLGRCTIGDKCECHVKPWSSEMMGGYGVRTFDTGATRDTDHDKIDPEGFLSPLVIERYCEYMRLHREQVDGTIRASDNWQKGIPLTAYIKSLWRHFLHVWKLHRQGKTGWEMEDALCALLFNAMGYLYEVLKAREKQK